MRRLFELQVRDLVGVENVQPHGRPGPFAVSGFDEMDDLPVILQGVGDALFKIGQVRIDGLIDDGHELRHELVMACQGNGVVEVLLDFDRILTMGGCRTGCGSSRCGRKSA